MFYVRWGFTLLVLSLLAMLLHYTLPQHDVVRIVETDTRRVDFGENSIFWSNVGSGDAEGMVNRDVFFIRTVRENGRPMVYRNEDTGWVWPPYFKLNSSNLQTLAQDLVSTDQNNPRWAVVRHYGWRFEPLSIYPNAVAVWEVDGPDYRVTNWFNIVFLIVFAILIWAAAIRIRRFRERRIDPVIEDISDSFEAAGDAVGEQRGRLRKWLDSWRQT